MNANEFYLFNLRMQHSVFLQQSSILNQCLILEHLVFLLLILRSLIRIHYQLANLQFLRYI
jgi:hypothetical protein